jgi:hypothetical protein
VQSNLNRRTRRVERQAENIVSYAECGLITCQMLEAMKAGMLKNLDDPGLVAGILDEMTGGHANRMLKPLGLGIAWRMP